MRRGDDEWFAIAKWVVYGLIEAEEYGITQANVDTLLENAQKLEVTEQITSTGDYASFKLEEN